jgi:hypothetical protein
LSTLILGVAMAFPVLVAVGAAVAVAVYTFVSGLRRNIAKARKTGLVYFALRKWRLPSIVMPRNSGRLLTNAF